MNSRSNEQYQKPWMEIIELGEDIIQTSTKDELPFDPIG